MSTTNFDFPRSGYSAIQLIARTERTVVYRGVETDGQKRSVIIKLLVAAYPTHQEIIDFRHQYQISRHLDLGGVVRVYDLQTHDRGYALVMEDFGGISLANYAEMVELSIDEIVAIAIRVTDILEAIGQQGIVHKDIKPANILINPATKEVKLIDFGAASLLPREMAVVVGPSLLAGTLAYMPPEQTGRMNRGVDYRSDFYALGATLYQLLTGKLPFDSQDPLELIHAHLAIDPRTIAEIKPDIPRALSQIVAKLMAKDADLRYQTALGIKYDLESYHAAEFELGKGDLGDRFAVSERLYGRELEIHTLLAACERVAAGNTEMMLVAGNSGIGKTAVINEVHKPIARHHGYFIAGKFDQFDRHSPLSAFVSAFSDLVGQLLGESEDILARWREQILTIVGDNGGVLTAVIPELELIIGRQPQPVELEGTAAQNRFNWLFQKFVDIFTTAAHPLTIFLDDLQWADAASLEFIKLLMEEDRYLFLLGAYRDNEVSKIHPTIATIDRLRQSGKIVSTIMLKPLSIADTNRLVTDTLKSTAKLAQPLTEFIYQKTQGNPFFITQFLTVLHRDGKLKFNHRARGWECDMSQIQTLSITDDVVAFMAARLQKIPASSQSLLQLAACYGDRFDLHTLAVIADRSPVDTATDLWCALQQGLILPIDCIYKLYQNIDREEDLVDREGILPTAEYRFAHDRIQQAAYSLIPADCLHSTQLNIGRLLLAKTSDFTNSNRSLKVVDLLNAGEPSITTSLERIQLMKMNLWVAKKAKANTANRAALDYSLQGIKLLGSNPWQQHYQYTLALYEIAADAAYLTGDRHLNLYIDTVLEHTIDPLDRCGVLKTKILAAIGKSNLEMAIDLTINALAELDFKLNKQVDRATAAAEILKTEAVLLGKDLDEIDRQPSIGDRRIIAIMGFLNLLVSTAYSVYPNLLVVVANRMVRLSLRYGNCDYSGIAYAIYGTVLSGGLQQIEAGIKYSKYALKILDRRTNDNLRSSAIYISMFSTRAWDTSIREIARHHQKGYELGLASGNFEHGAWNLFKVGWSLYAAGEDLHSLHELVTTNRQLLAALGQEVQYSFNNRLSQSINNLLGNNTDPLCFSSEHFDDRGFVENCLRSQYTGGIPSLDIEKLMLYYLFGDLDNAKQASDRCYPYLEKIFGQFANCLFNFYSALTLIEIDAKDGLAKPELKKLNEHQQQLNKWAKHAPMNAQHKWELIEARRMQQLGDFVAAVELFDRAIAGAKLNKFQQEEALANELAAKFYLAWGRDKIAATYMQEAYYGYAKWGAKAKTDDLEKRYPVLLAPILRNAIIEFDSISTLATLANTNSQQSSDAQKIENLDFISVMQSAQLLSSTIEIDELIATLSDILIKYAEVQTCIIALPDRNDKWQLKSIAKITNNGSEFTPIDRELAADLSDYPSNIIYWTKNSRSTFTGDGANSLPVADLYLLDRQPRSILSVPIVKQEKVLGVVYLEHRDLPDLFTIDRQTVISFLINQAAPAGNLKWIRGESYGTLREDGVLVRDGVLLDVTDRKLAELALQESESRYQQIVSNIPAALFQFKLGAGGEQQMNYVSSKFNDLLDLPHSVDLSEIAIDSGLLPEDREGFVESIARSARTGESWEWESQIVTSQGNRKWIRGKSNPVYHDDGSIVWDGILLDITERKEIELALQASERRYQQLADNLPVALYQFEMGADGSCAIEYVSSRMYDIFEIPPEVDFGSINIGEGVHPEDMGSFTESIAASAASGEMWVWEGRFMMASGDVKWIRCESTPTRNADGSVLWDGILVDISERKQADIALKESKQFLETILDSFPLLIFWKDRESNFLGGNQQFLTVTGKTSMEELIGKSDFDMPWSKEEAEAYRADDREVIDGEIAKLGIIETQTQIDGSTIWLETNKVPLRDPQGRVIGIVGTLQDVTAREQADIALKESKQFLETVLDSFPLYVFWKDRESKYLGGNQKFISAAGRTSMDELIGKSDFDLPWSKEEAEAYRADDREVIDGAITKLGIIETQTQADERFVWVETNKVPLHDPHGQVIGIVGTFQDVTDREIARLDLKQANDRLEQTVIELQRATKLKDEFLATMSHELRTPLNSVLGMSEALQEQVFGDLNPAQIKSLKTIDRSGRHLLSLINDILDLSKISAGKLELNITDFSLSYLCTSSLAFVRQQAHTKQIEIAVNLPPQPITVRADERRLRQVAINLLSNAVKFTTAGGRVTLQVKQIAASDRADNRRWLELSVIDTGIGIAAGDIDRLCQPFTQLDSSLNRHYEGTGLGLALSKQIVELHGGSIAITSQVGSGSCFTVRLPDLVTISSTSDLVAYTPPSEELDNGGSHTPASATILLVEDNEANIHTFASYLTAKGYHTLLANSGKQALEILATHRPDAIVMDIQMPEIDGIEAIDRIRNDLQLTDTPIIALTALAMAGDREKCLAAGADEYMTKPVRLRELAATIQQLIAPVASGEVILNS